LLTAHDMNWSELTLTDLQQVDPVTRRVHWSHESEPRTWLAAAKLGRFVLSRFWTVVFQCNWSSRHGVRFSSVSYVRVLWTSLKFCRKWSVARSLYANRVSGRPLHLSARTSSSVRFAEKRSRGSIKFRSLRPKGPIAGVEFLGKAHQQRGWGRCTSLSGVRGGAPAAQRFSCTLRSPDSLLCCIIRGKQLQKSLNGSKVVAATPLGQKLHEQGGYQL